MKRGLLTITAMLCLPTIASASDTDSPSSAPSPAPTAQAVVTPSGAPAAESSGTPVAGPSGSPGNEAPGTPVVGPADQELTAVPAGAQTGAPIMWRPRMVNHPRRGLVVGGIAEASAIYLISVFAAIASSLGADLPSLQYLYIPVAGPFIFAADSNLSDSGRVLVLIDGALQLIGVVGILAAFVFPQQRMEYERAGRHAPRWAVVPAIMGGGFGLSFGLSGF